MKRRRLWRVIFLLIPALVAAFFSSEFQPVKDLLLEPIYIRWAVNKNDKERTQTFAFHNSGQQPAELRICFRAMPRMTISDFAASTFTDGPYNSFTDALTHIDSPRFDRRSLTRLIDPHVHFPSLVVLENELRTAAQKNDERLPEIHGKWLEVCQAKECSKEEAFEAWERPINALRTIAISNWYTTTGWQVYFTEGYVSPAAEIDFVRKVEPHGTSYLTVHFRADKIEAKPDIQSPNRPGTKVDFADIHAGNLTTAWNHRRWPTLLAFAILVAIVALPFSRAKPLEQRPTYELVNLALRADREDPEEAKEIWDRVYDRIHNDLMKGFEAERAHTGRPAVRVLEGRLFDYVRNCLRTDYGINDQQYRTNQELDGYVNGCLEVFANI